MFLALLLVPVPATAQMIDITFLHTPRERVLEGQDLIVSGSIAGADQVSIAALSFRWAGEENFEIRELKLVAGEQYQGVIPGEYVRPPAIEYFCYAVDFEGNRHAIFASEQRPHQITVVTVEELEEERVQAGKTPQPVVEDDGTAQCPEPAWRPAGRQVTVTARSPEPLEEAAGTVVLIGRDRIQDAGAATLADVLDQVAGLTVSRSVAGDYLLAVRGLRSTASVLFLLDDVPLNDPYDAGALLEFPAEAIERVEILRGPASQTHGPGALNGVVRVITRRDGFHASAGYGLFNTVRTSAGANHQGESWAIGGQVQFITTGGHDRTVEKDALTGLQATGDNGNNDVSSTPGEVDDARSLLHAQLQGRLDVPGAGRLGMLARYLYQNRGGYVGKLDTLDRGSDQALHLVQAVLDHDIQPLGWLGLHSRVSFDLRLVDRAFQVLPADSDNPYQTVDEGSPLSLDEGLRESTAYRSMVLGAEVDSRFRLSDYNLLTWGVAFAYTGLPQVTLERDTGKVSCGADEMLLVRGFDLACGSQDGGAAGHDRIRLGSYLQDGWKDLLPGLDLVAGMRVSWMSDVGLALAPRGAAIFRLLDGLWLRMQYGRAYRAPTMLEMYADVDFDPLAGVQGDDALGPVVADTVEASVEAHLGTRPVDLDLRGVVFAEWIQDAVGIDRNGSVPAYDNLEDIDVVGVEVELAAWFGPRNRLLVNGSWFRAAIDSAAKPRAGVIADVPQLRLNLGLDLAVLSWLNAHLGLRYGSQRRNNVREPLELLHAFRIPAYTLVRVGVTTEPFLFGHLVLFAHLTNLFDHPMRDPAPRPDRLPGLVPRAPFSFMAGIAWMP